LSENKICKEKRLNASAVLHNADRNPHPVSLMKLPTNVVHYHNMRDKVATLLNQHKSSNDQDL
jgi:hypothetical protein